MNLQNNLVFEEVEASELNGNGRDAILGFGTGLGIVAAGVTILT